MNTKHPESENLNDYLQQPQAEKFSALRLHLASCVDCRNQLEVLSSLQQHYDSIQNDSIDDAQQQQIEDFINIGNNDLALQEIKNNPAALKAALHYASHSAAMSEAIQPEAQVQKKISVVKQLQTFLTGLFAYQSPVWISSAVSIALVLVVIMVPLTDKPVEGYSGKSIVQYQDNPQIHFRSQDALPGIGFFSKAEEQSLPFAGMRVMYLQPNIIRLSWPAVDNAKNYKLRLQMISQGKKNTLKEINTELNQLEVKLNGADINHRYVWTLSGLTRNGKIFLTSGGFVIGDR